MESEVTLAPFYGTFGPFCCLPPDAMVEPDQRQDVPFLPFRPPSAHTCRVSGGRTVASRRRMLPACVVVASSYYGQATRGLSSF